MKTKIKRVGEAWWMIGRTAAHVSITDAKKIPIGIGDTMELDGINLRLLKFRWMYYLPNGRRTFEGELEVIK